LRSYIELSDKEHEYNIKEMREEYDKIVKEYTNCKINTELICENDKKELVKH
jgi:hypothetical protein